MFLFSNPMLAPHVTRASVNSKRVLVFVVPVAILSVALNVPRFLDLEVTEDGNREDNVNHAKHGTQFDLPKPNFISLSILTESRLRCSARSQSSLPSFNTVAWFWPASCPSRRCCISTWGFIWFCGGAGNLDWRRAQQRRRGSSRCTKLLHLQMIRSIWTKRRGGQGGRQCIEWLNRILPKKTNIFVWCWRIKGINAPIHKSLWKKQPTMLCTQLEQPPQQGRTEPTGQPGVHLHGIRYPLLHM